MDNKYLNVTKSLRRKEMLKSGERLESYSERKKNYIEGGEYMPNNLPEEHQAVYNVIASNKEKYITKDMILVRLGKGQSYKRKLEQIIYNLVVKYSCPIGSSSAARTKGFFIITDKHDLHIAKRDLTSRTFTINKRVKALDEIKF